MHPVEQEVVEHDEEQQLQDDHPPGRQWPRVHARETKQAATRRG